MTGLYYYKLVSPYEDDVTKNCKLTVNEIDHNFFQLKSEDISGGTYTREGDRKGILTFTRVNGDSFAMEIDATIDKNLTYDFSAVSGSNESGMSLTISYKDDEGEKKTVSINNILTTDRFFEIIGKIIGSGILTKVITDATLKGMGTMFSPLGLSGVEKTGMLAPAIKVIDHTDGTELPEISKYGDRFVTKEYVCDYGYLYNGNGVRKITELLNHIYDENLIEREVEHRNFYWRVPTKADWDKLLNSIEPCDFKNHHSAECHVELGKFAGKFLKSECGWVWQEACTCLETKPHTGCTVFESEEYDSEDGGYIDDENFETPEDKRVNPVGVDKYGMTVLAAGISSFVHGTPRAQQFGERSAFWSTSHVYGDRGQDLYVKVFDYNKSGVYQVGECPDNYYGVRLVKDYNGSNYREAEYIDGVMYKAILFPESRQIWLASSFANTKGFDRYVPGDRKIPDYLIPNNGDGINERRIEMFINEWNGRYWERKVMNVGDTIVIENTDFDRASGVTEEICWYNEDGEHCVEVEIPKLAQSNIEYRVYAEEDSCDKILVNTDDIVVERVAHLIIPMLLKEEYERKRSDEILSGMIETEREERISADTEIWNTIDEINSDIEELSGAVETLSGDVIDLREDLDAEIERATQREDEIEEELIEEIDRAKSREYEIEGQLIDSSKGPFTLSVSTDGEYNLVLPSKDEKDEHSIKMKFDGNFGEI